MKRKLSVHLLLLFLTVCLGVASAAAQAKNAGKKTEPAGNAQKSEKKAAEIIDINSASKQQLMTLPGVGDVTAQKIIDGRPYRGKNDLVRQNIVNQATYDKISGQIIAKQSTAAANKKAEPADKGAAKKGAGKKK